MSKKLSKDEIRNPDAMTQELRKGFSWSVAHSKMILGVMGVLLLGGLVYAGVSAMNHKKEAKYQEQYYRVEKDYLAQKEKFETPIPPPTAPATPDKKGKVAPVAAAKTAQTPSGDIEKDYGPAVKGLQEVIQEAPGSRASRMAALVLSDIYSQYQKKDLSLEVLKKTTLSSDLLSILVEDRMAGLMADQGDCKTAIGAWDRILSKKPSAFMANELKLKKGLCFENLKDFTQAQVMYSQAKEGDANSPVAKRAEKYLRLLPPAASKN